MLVTMSWILSIILLSKLGLAIFIEKPQNQAVTVGSEVLMTCKINATTKPTKGVYWFRGDMQINDGYNITRESKGFNYSILNENVPGQKLKIKDVHLHHAGDFKCLYGGEEAFAKLIVLASHCEVTNGTKSKSKMLHCSVEYRGNWKPEIEWTLKGSPIEGKHYSTNYTISSTIELKINNSINSLDYSDYRCVTYFSPKSKTEDGYATNLPSNFTCIPGGGSHQNGNGDQSEQSNVTWIVIGCAAATCIAAALVGIVICAKKHTEVCRKSYGPDIVQQAGIAENGENMNGEYRVIDVDQEAERFVMAEPHDPNDDPSDDPAHDRVYAEVLICERNLPLPPCMHDSPAWNYSQASPAISHCSRNIIASQNATPRNGSPIIGLDGTQYLDINSVATIPGPSGQMPRRPPARLPTSKYHPAVYAPIDHTARPPPPPPPSDE